MSHIRLRWIPAFRVDWASYRLTFILLAMSALAVLALVFMAAVWAGAESDAAALDRQRGLVNSRLKDQLDSVAHELQLMSAGYASLLHQTSGKIASSNTPQRSYVETFGNIATNVFGFNAAFVINRSGELAVKSDTESVRRYKWIRPLLTPLIKELKDAQAKGGERTERGGTSRNVALLRLEGRPSIAGVAPIRNPSAVRGPEPDERPTLYLVAFRFLDGATLDALSREQGLAGARYARTADQEKNEVAFPIEATADKEPIGFIIWAPDLPGSRVIGQLTPVLSFVGLLIAGLIFILMARLRASLQKLSASELHARHLSLHDVLTGLPNRALFSQKLEESIASPLLQRQKAALALIDLDHFKEVNDEFGHAAGDELLQSAVERMKSVISPSLTLARLGGDEFALLIPDSAAVDQVCRAIIAELNRPFMLCAGTTLIRIGCSIGIIAFDEQFASRFEVLRRADVALYAAKEAGRGRLVVYEPFLDHKIELREAMKADLRLLLQRPREAASHKVRDKSHDVGALEVFFQGVHKARDPFQLSGAEALVRWRHPAKGLLAPDAFIPLVEEAGLMDRLGAWVLKRAAESFLTYPSDLTLAVNIAPSQIKATRFDEDVLSILGECGLPPSRLELEITEAALFDIGEHGQEMLARLRSHGVRIALDDFGTGYSSLSHLVRFDIDRIKIDKSFVQLLGTKAEGAAIVSAVLSLSASLGKEITAEGVETEGQRDFLSAAGCTDLQGYLLSHPVPSYEFLVERLPQKEVGDFNRL